MQARNLSFHFRLKIKVSLRYEKDRHKAGSLCYKHRLPIFYTYGDGTSLLKGEVVWNCDYKI